MYIYLITFFALRLLSTYIVWTAMKKFVPHLSKQFREARQEFKERLLGTKSNETREKVCFGFANELIGSMLGGLFIRTAFRPKSKEKVCIQPQATHCRVHAFFNSHVMILC